MTAVTLGFSTIQSSAEVHFRFAPDDHSSQWHPVSMPTTSHHVSRQLITSTPGVLAELVIGDDEEMLVMASKVRHTPSRRPDRSALESRMEAAYDTVAKERAEGEGVPARALLRANMLRRARGKR